MASACDHEPYYLGPYRAPGFTDRAASVGRPPVSIGSTSAEVPFGAHVPTREPEFSSARSVPETTRRD